MTGPLGGLVRACNRFVVSWGILYQIRCNAYLNMRDVVAIVIPPDICRPEEDRPDGFDGNRHHG